MSNNKVTKTILIDGMTCVSCENRIERKLSATAGVESAKVSFANGIAVVTFDPEIITLSQIEEIIEALDYRIKKPEELTNKKPDITKILAIVIILYAVYMILNRFGLLEIFNRFPVASEEMGYGMLFLIGILTSVHCVAMCGGICLSQCVPQREDENRSKFSALRPSLLYNLGRVISYTVIGGIIGGIGSVVSFSGSLKGIVQILAGIFMVIMGLNMLNLFPWLRKLNPRMPKIFARKINAEKKSKSPLYVGLLNGLMPCGPLQAMQLYALSTGNVFEGALSMFLFSIGTVPLMLAFGALSSFLSKKFTSKMMTAGAVMVVILGAFMFNNGITLSGVSIPTALGSAFGSDNSSKNKAVIENGIQTITTELSSGRYEPITVQKGIPVKWTIKAEESDINGCNYSIQIPKFDITYEFQPGDNVIEFTPEESGTFSYSCWMGMIRSKITVVDDLTKVSKNDSATDDPASESGSLSCCAGLPAPGSTSGSGNPSDANRIVNYTIPTEEVILAKMEDGVQQAAIDMEASKFSPAVIVVQKDIETELTINASDIDSGNDTLLFPFYNATLPLQEGENKAYLIPKQDFDFSSSDYSFFGYVKVVDDINNIDIEEIKKEVASYVPTIREIEEDYGYGAPGSGASCH